MIIICGPTATGKTFFGLELAKRINGEIISADSRQIYKYLTVGTAKPSGKWINNFYTVDGIFYHLVDFLNPDETFNVGDFVDRCEILISDIKKRNRIPIIVGGTGLYIKSLIYGLSELPEKNTEIRNKLFKISLEKGREYLYKKLQNIDHKISQKIHPNNIHRIIRALEVYELTGVPMSELIKQKQKNRLKEKFLLLGLYLKRNILYDRIVKRTQEMLRNGFIEETEKVLKLGFKENSCGFQSLGYKYVIEYLKKQINYDEMFKKIVLDTKHYAKRQNTWFKSDKNIVWFDVGDIGYEKIIDIILNKYGTSYCSWNKIS